MSLHFIRLLLGCIISYDGVEFQSRDIRQSMNLLKYLDMRVANIAPPYNEGRDSTSINYRETKPKTC